MCEVLINSCLFEEMCTSLDFMYVIIKNVLHNKVSSCHTVSQKKTRRDEKIEVRVRQKQNMYRDSLGISTAATVCTL